ncbi:hypothetical protein AB0F72_08685 [Actinoplanes sp. NPDC023936]|uniref:hypothetical protein n=1 Tax=Actinoplanes sp. NPDC023936 TaxID=3154910 RepID=UPI0033EB8813
MAHLHAARLEIRPHDGAGPTVYENVSYTPHRGGVVVYKDDREIRHDEAYAVVGEPAGV